jgi:hypothetical protein
MLQNLSLLISIGRAMLPSLIYHKPLPMPGINLAAAIDKALNAAAALFGPLIHPG